MTLTIYSNGHIVESGSDTGLAVDQRESGTVLYRREIPASEHTSGQRYEELELPHKRYSLAHDKPVSGVPGRAQFEADVHKLLTFRGKTIIIL